MIAAYRRNHGFVLLMGLLLLALVGATLALLATSGSTDARRTLEKSRQAQLQQMLLAAVFDAHEHLSSKASLGDAWKIEMPSNLTSRNAAIESKIQSGDAAHVIIFVHATLDREAMDQTLKFSREENNWRMVSAELE